MHTGTVARHCQWVDPFKAFAGQTGAAPRSSWCRGPSQAAEKAQTVKPLLLLIWPLQALQCIQYPSYWIRSFFISWSLMCMRSTSVLGGAGGGGLGGICCFLGRQQRLADLHQVYGGLSGRHRGLGSRCKRSPLHFGRILQYQLDGIDVRPYRAGEDEGDDEEDGAVGGGRRGA